MNSDKINNVKKLIIVQSVLFVIFLIVTAWFNRFSSDDFYFIGELKSKSFKEFYSHLYFNWHGRWTSNISELLSFKISHIPKILFIFNILSFGFLFTSIFYFFKNINQFFNLSINKTTIRLYSLVFLGVLFFCSFSPSSTWFWHTSTVVYLWGISCFLFFIGALISSSTNFLTYFTLILSGIYFGGAYEPLAIITLLILITLFFFNFNKSKILIGFSFVLTALLIDYLSSGTKFRDEITPSLGFVDFFLYTGYGTLKLLFATIYKTIFPAILLAIPFYFLGEKSTISYPNFNLKKEIIVSLVIVLTIAIINQAIVIYALGGLAPNRSTLITSLTTALAIIRLFFLIGTSQRLREKDLRVILLVNCIGLFFFLATTSFVHFNYSKSYDERMLYIKNSTEKVIKVKPLANSGYIYSAEISSDSNYFSNQHLKIGLGLKRPVILEKNN